MSAPQQLRAEVLVELYAARPLSLGAEVIHRQLNRAGVACTVEQVRAELAFHVSAGHAVRVEIPTTGQIKFSITAQGTVRHENSD